VGPSEAVTCVCRLFAHVPLTRVDVCIQGFGTPIERMTRSSQGTFDMIQQTFDMIQQTFDMIRGTFDMLQGTFSITEGVPQAARHFLRPLFRLLTSGLPVGHSNGILDLYIYIIHTYMYGSSDV
jgi:hypothetical protein